MAHHQRVSLILGLITPFMARARAPALALAAFVAAGCPPGGGETETETEGGTATGEPAEGSICSRYVACLEVIDPAGSKAADAQFGASGSCWGESLADQLGCVDGCVDGLEAAHAAHDQVITCESPSPPSDAVLEVGIAVFDPNDAFADPVFGPLRPGDPLEMVRGGQGLLMFPIALRGARFEYAADPLDYDDPKMPQVDLWMDVDGFNIGFAGHFARVYNYPIPFKPAEAGVVQFLYIAIIVPDEITEPQALDGKLGHLWIEFQPYEEAPIVREMDVTIVVQDGV